VNVENVSRDDWILAGVALLLVIDLLFLPWFSISLGTLGSYTSSATGSPDSWAGVLAVLLTLVFIADLAIERLSPQTQLPVIGGSRGETRFIIAGVAAVFLLIKFLLQISHFSDLGFGFWVALVLTVALIYLALQARKTGAATRPGTV
jgi:FtsH-binding integral membrane protein